MAYFGLMIALIFKALTLLLSATIRYFVLLTTSINPDFEIIAPSVDPWGIQFFEIQPNDCITNLSELLKYVRGQYIW